MRLYYMIWVDFILRAKSQPSNKNNWQIMTMMFMSIIMAADFLFLMTILEAYILHYQFYKFQIPILPQNISEPLTFAILYGGPPLLVNYLLIFRKHRYEKLIKKYEYHDGKLAVTYMLLGLFIPLITMWIAIVYGWI
jgi:hypothetical protein